MIDLLAAVEAVDIAVAHATAPIDENRVVHLVGKLGGLGDQPPLRALSLFVIGAGVLRYDHRLAATGLKMFSAHTLATALKTIVKNRIDRTRPSLLIEDGVYEAQPGDSDEHDKTSFPSGHTAGLVALALVVGRAYPRQRTVAGAVAAGLALIQIPRRTHFVSDVVAGAAIGWTAAAAIRFIADGLPWPVTKVVRVDGGLKSRWSRSLDRSSVSRVR